MLVRLQSTLHFEVTVGVRRRICVFPTKSVTLTVLSRHFEIKAYLLTIVVTTLRPSLCSTGPLYRGNVTLSGVQIGWFVLILTQEQTVKKPSPCKAS